MASDLPGCSKQLPPTKKDYCNPSAVESLLQQSASLSTTDYHALVSELLKRSPCSTEQLKKAMNLAKERARKKQVCAHRSTDDAGACTTAPAAQVSLICRGDLIAAQNIFFLDTEKITAAGTHKTLSGDLAIVDEKGNLVLWCYINRDSVCKFNTKLTGLNSSKLASGYPVEMVQQIIERNFQGKDIWGADLMNDLKSLNYDPGSVPFNSWDIQDFYVDFANRPISLAYLAEHFLGENVQGDRHSSIQDARLTALCYKKMVGFKKQGMVRFNCPVMDELRHDPKNNPKNKTTVKYDVCRCGKAKPKVRGKANEAFKSTGSFDVDDWV